MWNDQGDPIVDTFIRHDGKIGHSGNVNSVTFSQDGSLIISGSGDGTIGIWDLTGQGIADSNYLGELFSTITYFSKDENTLIIASGSNNKTIRLWKWQKGENTIKPMGDPLKGHGGKVNSLAFSKDGQTLISGSSDGTIRLWDMRDIQNQSNLENKDLNSLLKIACDRLRYHPSLDNKAKQACEKKNNESIPTKTH